MSFEVDFNRGFLDLKEFFDTRKTLDLNFRITALLALKNSIKNYEEELIDALYNDLRKSEFESYETEIGIVVSDIGYIVKHLKSWAKPKRVKTPLIQFGASSRIYYEPYGTVLIIGPFNYPFQLIFEPLIGAIAAGNCAVVKPSESTPNVCKVINKIITETFDENYIKVIEGGKDVVSNLLKLPFDYIFFTGSVKVGKIVLESAAKNLTPVTLELGGKSPCIVHNDADIKTACERITWGKFMNAGQTCVAPDYLFVHDDIKEKFMQSLKDTIVRFYGRDAKKSRDYGRLVNHAQTQRLIEILNKDSAKIAFGGEFDIDDNYISPTIIDNADMSDASMQDEIFGPILPVIYYTDINEVVKLINKKQKPLALYLFTASKMLRRKVVNEISFGGGCINDTISHITTPELPFGGIGYSGMGAYHGKYSFETFSHRKSVMKKTTLFTAQPVFPPFNDKIKFIRKLLK